MNRPPSLPPPDPSNPLPYPKNVRVIRQPAWGGGPDPCSSSSPVPPWASEPPALPRSLSSCTYVRLRQTLRGQTLQAAPPKALELSGPLLIAPGFLSLLTLCSRMARGTGARLLLLLRAFLLWMRASPGIYHSRLWLLPLATTQGRIRFLKSSPAFLFSNLVEPREHVHE